jgi:hypothetical protein
MNFENARNELYIYEMITQDLYYRNIMFVDQF